MADETQPDASPEAATQTPPAPSAVLGPEAAIKTDTPAQQPSPTPAPSDAPAKVKAVLVNQFTRRSDEDALLGSWVDVVSGEYEGRRGAYVDDDTHDPETGYPDRVIVRTRDAENELIVVNYSDIRPSGYTGGR